MTVGVYVSFFLPFRTLVSNEIMEFEKIAQETKPFGVGRTPHTGNQYLSRHVIGRHKQHVHVGMPAAQ